MAWLIACRHSRRPDEAGVKFIHNKEEAVVERRRLEALGYLVTKIAEVPSSGPAAVSLPAVIGIVRFKISASLVERAAVAFNETVPDLFHIDIFSSNGTTGSAFES